MAHFDDTMHALADGNRRRILIDLRDEEHIDPFSGGGVDRNRTIQLHHVHLPLLEETGLVAWNRDTGIVRRGDGFEAAESILTALEDRRDALPDGYRLEEPDDGTCTTSDITVDRVD